MAKNIQEIIMKKKDFVKEHVNLVKILRKGNRKSLTREANDQAHELKGYLKK